MINGHGDDAFKYGNVKVNFSSNVYTHFDHEPLFCHLAEKLDNIVSYPEPAPVSLEMDLARMLRLKPEHICVTSGATEAIYLIAQTFRRSKTAIVQPTFSEYADACRLHEHTMCNIHNIDELPERAEMVWLCCPNNPTGSVTPRDILLKSIDNHQDTIFVIDASYARFTLQPLLLPHQAAERPNVLMLHSMTKEYTIPGLRLGYLTGCEALVQRVRLQRMPWSVNQVALAAAQYLLLHDDEYTIDIQALCDERRRVESALSSLGCIEVWPSDSHMLLCKLRFGKASSLKEYLVREHGLLIRDASNFDGLDASFFRIAVQQPEENDELVHAIAEWIAC